MYENMNKIIQISYVTCLGLNGDAILNWKELIVRIITNNFYYKIKKKSAVLQKNIDTVKIWYFLYFVFICCFKVSHGVKVVHSYEYYDLLSAEYTLFA